MRLAILTLAGVIAALNAYDSAASLFRPDRDDRAAYFSAHPESGANR